MLVAGGGTGDAATALAQQLHDASSEIVYVDMSKASMEIAQARVKNRGLDNVTWINDSLLNIPKLGLGKFDYINCSGVLHHLADPNEGLQILADATKDDGALGIMLYAKYGRMAVYQMQELLRLVNQNEGNIQTRVDNAKAILFNLPNTNWFHNSHPTVINEVRSGDIGIYDLLLHSQDRAYSIPELYEYVESANLNIVQFFADESHVANNLYKPAYYLKDERIIEIVNSLPIREQQTIAELLHGKILKHTFYAAKRVPALPDPDDLENIPLLGYDIFSEQDAICEVIRMAGEVVVLRQTSTGAVVMMQKTPHMELIFKYIDGKASLREIFRKVMDSPQTKATRPNFPTLAVEFKSMMISMLEYNWLFLRAQGTEYVVYPDVFQDRVKKLHGQ